MVCVAAALMTLLPTAATAQQSVHLELPFETRLASFKTKLLKKGPAPKAFSPQKVPDGVRQITYPSGSLRLKAWVKVPATRGKTKLPAVVYFHSEFAFKANQFSACQPFLNAGFIVMTPMLRGENGNLGDCEMFLGEVDDAMAAVNWLAELAIVDRSRIYTFGHSAGGVVSAMLSLRRDVPIRHGGSSGGLYGPALFGLIRDRVPFDLTNPVEREMRVLPPNVRWMHRKHYAFIGTEDGGVASGVNMAKQKLSRADNPQLEIIHHPGKHSSALAPAIQKYLEIIKKES